MELSSLSLSRFFGRFRHYLAELLLIVIGILIAFAINAWWGNFQQRQEEQRSITALPRQFNNYQEFLGQIRELQEYTSRLEKILLDGWLAGSPLLSIEDNPIDSVLGRILIPGTTDFGAGELESLLSSGRIDLISNQQVREQLIRWQGVYDELADDEELMRSLIMERIYPRFAELGLPLAGVAKALRGGNGIGGTGITEVNIPDERTLQGSPEQLTLFFSDRTMFSYFEQLAAMRQHSTMEKEATIAYIQNLLGMLDNYQP